VGSTATTGTAGVTGAGGTGNPTGTGGAGTGGTSGTAVPKAFALKTPNGDPTVSSMPQLTWEAAVGADSYTVEIATASTFGAADEVQQTGVTDTAFMPTAAVQVGAIHYWRVTAVNGAGTTVAGNAPRWFSTPAPVGPSPHGVAVTPDGMHAVVANDTAPGSVTLVDLAAFTTQPISVAGRPGLVAITPDGARALVPEGSPNNVAIVDLAGKMTVGAITPPCVATTLYGIAIKPSGDAAVMPDFNGGCTKDVLDVIPLPGSTIASTIDLGSSAGGFGVAVTTDGAAALVTRGVLGTSIKRVELAGGAITPINGTSSSFGVAVTPDGKEALVTSGEGDTVKRISLMTNAVTATIMFESNQDVGNIAIAPNGRYAVVAGDFKAGILSLADNTVVSSPPIAGRSVAITPDSGRALVTGAGATGKLYVIKLP